MMSTDTSASVAEDTSIKGQNSVEILKINTEVSAKYRGAFCEARIKEIEIEKIQVQVKLSSTNKSHWIDKEHVKGILKKGEHVECRQNKNLPYEKGILINIKDKSQYTVVFDDGDKRTLGRNSICLKGTRHTDESRSLDNWPLTDPEGFGSPVVDIKNKKPKRKNTPMWDSDTSSNYPTPSPSKPRKSNVNPNPSVITSLEARMNNAAKQEENQKNKEEFRGKWLQDKLLGKLVLVVEGKKKFPAVVVNPVIHETWHKIDNDHMLVRSFFNGEFNVVPKNSPLLSKTACSKSDPAVKDALNWQSSLIIPNCWRTDVTDIIQDVTSDEDDEDDVTEDKEAVSNDVTDDEEKLKEKNARKAQAKLFNEQLYKLMNDCGSPIIKPPSLANKDLDLFKLYNLVESSGGSSRISDSEWREIYHKLNPLKKSTNRVKSSYYKYLHKYEEYQLSFKNIQTTNLLPSAVSDFHFIKDETSRSSVESEATEISSSSGRRTTRRRKYSDAQPGNDLSDSGGPQKSKKAKMGKQVGSSQAVGKTGGKKAREKEEPPVYQADDDVWVTYQNSSFPAKVIKVIDDNQGEESSAETRSYLIHYKNWNKRHDQVVKYSRILGYQTEDDLTVEKTRGPPKKNVNLGQMGKPFATSQGLKRPRNRTSSCSSSNAGDQVNVKQDKSVGGSSGSKKADDKQQQKKPGPPRKKKAAMEKEEKKEEVKIEPGTVQMDPNSVSKRTSVKDSPLKSPPSGNKPPRQRRTKKQMQEALLQGRANEEVKVEADADSKMIVKKEIVKVKMENYPAFQKVQVEVKVEEGNKKQQATSSLLNKQSSEISRKKTGTSKDANSDVLASNPEAKEASSQKPEETKNSEDKPAQPPTQLKIPASKTTLTTSQEKVPMTSSAATADEEMTKTPLVEMMHGVATSSADVVTSTTTSQASTPTNDDNKTSCEEGSNNEQPTSSQQEKCPTSPRKHSKKAARKIEKENENNTDSCVDLDPGTSKNRKKKLQKKQSVEECRVKNEPRMQDMIKLTKTDEEMDMMTHEERISYLEKLRIDIGKVYQEWYTHRQNCYKRIKKHKKKMATNEEKENKKQSQQGSIKKTSS